MKINLTEKEINKFFNILETKERNIYVADLLNYFVTHECRYINKDDALKNGYYNAFLKGVELTKKDPNILEVGNKNLEAMFHKMDTEDFINDEYYKNVKPTPKKYKKYELSYEKYLPFEGFIADDIKVNKEKNFFEVSKIGYFDKEFEYLAVKENDVIWMSMQPAETITMVDDLKLVKGNILVTGLGLGYFPYIASLKDEVKNIVIVELDKNIIDLFTENILPFFKNKEKITIVNQDIYTYFDNNDLSKFDFVYNDIWHSVDDGFYHYLKIKEYEKKYKNTKFLYWLIDGLEEMKRRCKISLIYEQLNEFKDSYYKNGETPFDDYINDLYFKTKKLTLNSIEEVIEFIDKY